MPSRWPVLPPVASLLPARRDGKLGNDGVAQTSVTPQDHVIEMRLSGWPFRLLFSKNPFPSAPAGRIERRDLWRLYPPI